MVSAGFILKCSVISAGKLKYVVVSARFILKCSAISAGVILQLKLKYSVVSAGFILKLKYPRSRQPVVRERNWLMLLFCVLPGVCC